MTSQDGGAPGDDPREALAEGSDDAPAEVAQGGDFAAAMRTAVAARGLSLDRLRAALEEREIRVSAATLSYWQTGRSRPERAASLAAIGPLEDVLQVPRGFLASRLPHRHVDPNVPGADYVAGDLTVLPADHRWTAMGESLQRLGLGTDDGFARVSVHDRIRLRADGVEERHEVRTVLLAVRDGADRYPVWFEWPSSEVYPAVIPVHNCRTGRTVEFRDPVVGVGTEMILPRPLRAGETTVVEHRLEALGNRQRDGEFMRGIVGQVRELVFEVTFEPPSLPDRIWYDRVVDGERTSRPLEVAETVTLLLHDSPGGVHGVRWEW